MVPEGRVKTLCLRRWAGVSVVVISGRLMPRHGVLGMSDELTAALNTPEVSRYALRTEALAGYWKA
jgi:hypothetical protein